MRLRPCPQIARFGELIPEVQRRIPPPARRPSRPVRNLRATIHRCRQHQLAHHRIVRGQRGVTHHQPRNPLPAAIPIATSLVRLLLCGATLVLLRPDGVLNRERDPHAGRLMPAVGHAIAQNCYRQSRVVRLMRNERRKRIQFHLHRQRAIRKVDMRQWILTCKRRRLQPAQTRNIARSQAVLPLVRRQNARLQHTHHSLPAPRPRPDSRKRIRRPESLVGPVEDLPIDQLSAAAQPKAARRNTAQRKRNHLQLPSAKAAWIVHVSMGLAAFPPLA